MSLFRWTVRAYVWITKQPFIFSWVNFSGTHMGKSNTHGQRPCIHSHMYSYIHALCRGIYATRKGTHKYSNHCQSSNLAQFRTHIRLVGFAAWHECMKLYFLSSQTLIDYFCESKSNKSAKKFQTLMIKAFFFRKALPVYSRLHAWGWAEQCRRRGGEL